MFNYVKIGSASRHHSREDIQGTENEKVTGLYLSLSLSFLFDVGYGFIHFFHDEIINGISPHPKVFEMPLNEKKSTNITV